MEKTLALIKPDAVAAGNEKEIEQLIEMHGFHIIGKKRLQLTKKRAEEFYGEHFGKPFFEGLVEFMTSGPIVALCLGREGAIKAWRGLMGPTNSLTAKEQSPKSLRAIFGTDGRRNATHGSDSPASAFREIKFFFPEVVVDPITTGEQARIYLSDKLNPTLIKALTALASERPTQNPLQAITWLSDWLLENNPNRPRVALREELPLDPARLDDGSAFSDALAARQMAQDATSTLNAAFSRPERDESTKLVPPVPIELAPQEEEAADVARHKTVEPAPAHASLPTAPAPAPAPPPPPAPAAPAPAPPAAPSAAPPEEAAADAALDGMTEDEAAARVQALYRGHMARKQMAVLKEGGSGEGAAGDVLEATLAGGLEATPEATPALEATLAPVAITEGGEGPTDDQPKEAAVAEGEEVVAGGEEAEPAELEPPGPQAETAHEAEAAEAQGGEGEEETE